MCNALFLNNMLSIVQSRHAVYVNNINFEMRRVYLYNNELNIC